MSTINPLQRAAAGSEDSAASTKNNAPKNKSVGRYKKSYASTNFVTSSALSGDGKSILTIEHGEVYGRPKKDATVTIRSVDTGATLQEFKSEKPVTSSALF